MQLVGQRRLHPGERVLGDADLVAASGRRDDAFRVLRVLGEGGDVARQPPHRPHDQPVQREVDETRRDPRDDQRQQQDVARERQQGGAQRALVEDELDGLDAAHAVPDHPDRTPGGVEQRRERAADQRQPVGVAQVDDARAGRRRLPARQHAPRSPPSSAIARAPTPERRRASRAVAEPLRRRGLQDQGRDLRGGDPVRQPVAAEVGDRGHVDQHLGDHDEGDGEDEQPAGQAEHAREPPGRGAAGVAGGHARAHPNRRARPIRPRTHRLRAAGRRNSTAAARDASDRVG